VTNWQGWIGRSQTQSDTLTPALVQRHRATLDLSPVDSAPLPGIHWVLNVPEAATAELGEDGHPRRDLAHSFLPPIDLPRRMWASSDVEFLAPIAVGATVTRTTTIADIVEKSGGSGRLAFVTLAHDVFADGALAVSEKQTLVYREAVTLEPQNHSSFPRRRESITGQSNSQGQAMDSRLRGNDKLLRARADWPHQTTLTPSETLLFRFSALTFNTHRIHYDLPYARDVEGYRGLVVHGPLTATLLLNWATGLFGPLRHFAFRAVAPAFAGEPLTLFAREEAGGITLAAIGPDRTDCIKASAAL
jgi:3-methylfumaryl-CoA hydratase